jgi:hypothetical protein
MPRVRMSNASVTEFSGSPKCLVLLPQGLWPCPERGRDGFFNLPERRRLNPDVAAMGYQLRKYQVCDILARVRTRIGVFHWHRPRVVLQECAAVPRAQEDRISPFIPGL